MVARISGSLYVCNLPKLFDHNGKGMVYYNIVDHENNTECDIVSNRSIIAIASIVIR